MSSIYSPLESERRQIRVLHIHPGSWEDVLSCDMVTVSLLDNPDYDALSYAWEDQSPSIPVRVNGGVIKVTDTLAAALRRLRRADVEARLWVDGACINQADATERGHQVSMMCDVFRKAANVRVWLGEVPEDWCSRVEETLRDKGARLDLAAAENDSLRRGRAVDEEGALFAASTPTHGPGFQPLFNLLEALNECEDKSFLFTRQSDGSYTLEPVWRYSLLQLFWLVCRPVWSRLWVVQEIALATNDPVVHFGANTVSFAQFTIGIQEIKYPHEVDTRCDESTQLICVLLEDNGDTALQMSYFRRLVSQTNGPFLAHLDTPEMLNVRSTFYKATDARDRYYALLGIFQHFRFSGIRADYTVGVEEVFTKATIDLISRNGDMRHLNYAVRLYEPDEEEWYQIPSWCIHWGHVPPRRLHWGANSTYEKHVGHEVASRKRGAIEIDAALVGTVSGFVSRREAPDDRERVYLYVRDSADLALRQGVPYQSAAFSEALFPRSFPVASDRWSADDAGLSIQEWCRRIVESPERVAELPDHGKLGRALAYLLESSKPQDWTAHFFSTTEGKIGCHTNQIQANDKLFAIAGCHNAVVLRPVPRLIESSTSPVYRFAGLCHLQGFDINNLLDTPERWSRITLC